MAIDESRIQILDRTSVQQVSLSRWVNEPLPSCEELLTAHDVARLTRRPHWTLATLALLGCFPKKQRFHGRRIGWRRRDVLQWLGTGNCLEVLRPETTVLEPAPTQHKLDLGCSQRSRRTRVQCSSVNRHLRRCGCPPARTGQSSGGFAQGVCAQRIAEPRAGARGKQ